ncbi:hypothetical protein P3G55_26545, partial [Leptospira sp. 96542]|nr:hypothetical protein [Leptospira sp. 96542]
MAQWVTMRRLARRLILALASSRRGLPLVLLCTSGLLLAACASPRGMSTSAGLKPPTRGTAATPAPAADDPASYRLDTARHLYGQNRERIYAGVMPHYLRARGVLGMGVDAQGPASAPRWP